jgi:hypothetical protein
MATCPCHVCGSAVPDRAYDVVCSSCLSTLRAELAGMLKLSYWRSAGFAFGEPLEHILRRLPMPKTSFTKSLKVKLPGSYHIPPDPSPKFVTLADMASGATPPPADGAPMADPAKEAAQHVPKRPS